MGLPYLPTDLLDDVAQWDFTNKAQSAMQSIGTAGASIMAPLGTQISQGLQQIMPQATVSGSTFHVPGSPMGQPETSNLKPETPPVPDVQPFSLGKPEDWLRGLGAQAPAQQQQQQDPITLAQPKPPGPATPLLPQSDPSAGFKLPSVSEWLGGGRQPTQTSPNPTQTPANPALTTGPVPQTAPGGPIDNSSRSAFVASAWPHMLQAAGGNRDAAEMMLAAAISENGDVGKGGGFIGNNFYGIKGKGPAGSVNAGTWEQTPQGPVQIKDDFAAYNTPVEGFGGFFDFLKNNPRYAPALAAYGKSGDASQLFRDVNAAGYATDPQWADKVANIRANQVAPITGKLSAQPAAPSQLAPAPGLAAAQPLPPPAPVRPGSPSASPAPPWGTYTPESLVPNQFTQGQAEGLTSAQSLAICGPAAAVAFARANGRNPTLTEAKQLAQSLGVWDESVGMHGPASEVNLLGQMGIPASLSQGADWGAIQNEVGAGRPVIIDTPRHYYVASGYDPQTGEFEFGQSAGVLKAANGRTRFRPDQLAGLGMGAPRATITMGGQPR